VDKAPILGTHGTQRNTREQMECGVGSGPVGSPEGQRWSHAQKIQTMISGRDNQSVRSTKMKIADQNWPNLRYKTYSKPCLNILSSFA
jgi:hypothetical protein